MIIQESEVHGTSGLVMGKQFMTEGYKLTVGGKILQLLELRVLLIVETALWKTSPLWGL